MNDLDPVPLGDPAGGMLRARHHLLVHLHGDRAPADLQMLDEPPHGDAIGHGRLGPIDHDTHRSRIAADGADVEPATPSPRAASGAGGREAW
jgi:hypothetical protein